MSLPALTLTVASFQKSEHVTLTIPPQGGEVDVVPIASIFSINEGEFVDPTPGVSYNLYEGESLITDFTYSSAYQSYLASVTYLPANTGTHTYKAVASSGLVSNTVIVVVATRPGAGVSWYGYCYSGQGGLATTPLPGVTVLLTFTDGTTASAVSDATGEAYFTLNKGQNYGVTKISATCPGYTQVNDAGYISIPPMPSGIQLVTMEPTPN